MSQIQEYFANKTVLVTGATGFLGKALVEKILRSLPKLHRLYLLIRPKDRGSRTMSAEQRFHNEVLKSSIFDHLKRELGDNFDDYVDQKIAIVAGDLTDERLGVSEDDYRRLTTEVEVIINSAAVVVFDERLDLSLNLNTFGAQRMLQTARDCARLQAVIHISTCYVSGTAKGWVKEAVEPLPFDFEAEAANLESECAAIKQRFADDPQKTKAKLVELGLESARARGWHDTYTFTKALGEQFIAKYRGDLPTVILRPAIIESTFAEPEPGWIDGFRMGDPLFVGYGKGYLQDFPGRPDTIADLVPCDHVVNAILAAVPTCAREGGFRIYQSASGEQNPVHFRTIYDSGREYFRKNPMYERDGTAIPVMEWSWPDTASYRRKLVWQYRAPLTLGRALLRPFSFLRPMEKWRRRLAVRRASLDLLLYYVDIYSPYTSIQSRYMTGNTAALWASLGAEDQRLFPFDPRGIDWHDYITNVHIPGLKRNVLNLAVEDPVEGMGVPVRTIPDLLSRSADRFPSAVALQMKRDGRWLSYTYDDVERLADEAAATLHELHIHKGDRVLLYADNQPEWAIAYLAAVSLGAVVAPTDRQLREVDVLAVARFLDAKAILTSASIYENLSPEACLAEGGPLFLNIHDDCRPFKDAASAGKAPMTPRGHHSSLIGPDDLASIIITTGLHSGDPRAVMLTHRNFLSNVMGVAQLLPPRSDDNFISVLPLHHTLEFTGGLLVPFFVGAKVTYCDTMRSKVILETMRETQATTLIGVPRVYQILHDAIRRQVSEHGRRGKLWFDLLKVVSNTVRLLTGRNIGRRLFGSAHRELGGKLRAFISGGAVLSPRIFNRFTAMGFELCEGYGLTETAPITTVNPLGAAKKGSVGVPLPGVEVRILNPDDGGVGEIAVRGPNVTLGYYHNSEATASVLRDGWLHTGDVGYLDRDRYLFLTGRIKDIIVTAAGKNVYPEEVERLYAGLPSVSQLCVMGVWDEEVLGETIHAVLVPNGDGVRAGAAFEENVRQAIQQRSRSLPTYQRLQRIHVFSGDLPRDELGVIDRQRVKQRLVERLRSSWSAGAVIPEEPPQASLPHRNGTSNGKYAYRAAVEDDARNIVSGLSGVPRSRVMAQSDLENDLRLDSLLRVEMLLALETHFHVPLPESLGASLHTFGDVLEAVQQRVESDVAVAELGTKPVAWGKVLAPKMAVDHRRWLRVGPGKAAVRVIMRQLMRLYAWSWFNFEVHGAENLPSSAFIVAANHCSHLDTGAVVTAFGSRGGDLFVMGARDYFFNRKLKGWFFHTFLNVIPFHRKEKVIEGLRLAQAVLASGRPVLIFPEGKRSVTGKLQTFKPGIGLLGLELGVPIVPCYIEGAYDALPKGKAIPRRSRIRVTFAPPVSMDSYRTHLAPSERVDVYRRIAEDVRAAIDSLQNSKR